MFRKAIVVEVHHEDYSVDVVMCDDGARLTGVPVLSTTASTRTGFVDLPEVPQKADKWDVTKRTGQEMEAMVGFMSGGNPFVVGFLCPQVSQMTFKEKRAMYRHRSDLYITVTEGADFEISHPSNAYIRIAPSADHENLENKNFDKNFRVDRNNDKHPTIRLGNNAFYIELTDSGDVNVNCRKMTIKTGGATTVIDPSGVTTTADVKAGNVLLRHHVHSGVIPGPGTTGAPVGG